MADEINNKNIVTERLNKAKFYLDEEYNLNDQLNWYDRKAVHNKSWHMRLGLIIITAGAAVSIVQLWSPQPPDGVHWSALLSAALGAIVIVAKGIDSLWKFDENWTNYRQAAEQMKRERRLYVNSIGPYGKCSEEDIAFQLFVKRIEQIIATEENTFWQEKTAASEKTNE